MRCDGRNGVARIFVWGGGTRYIFRHSVGGGVAEMFRDLNSRIRFSGGGGVVAEFFYVDKSITFPRFRDMAHFPGLLTHSNHVTTSINSRKKHLPKVWGARGATPLDGRNRRS